MPIDDADIRRVREATDLVAVVSEVVALRRVGRRWVGLCPFHDERTPSFSVDAELGLYYCFGCHAKGDAITFVRELQGLDFHSAVELLAARAGIRIEERAASNQQREGSSRRTQLGVLEAQARWYRVQLLAEGGAAARRYLADRGIDPEQVERFGVGWAPPSRLAPLAELGATAEVALAVGIRVRTSADSLVDPMAGRIVFPIRDVAGHPIAFGGRALPPVAQGVPKYRNTQDTPLYHKRRTLYNLDRARATFLRERVAVVCEGYTDVIALDALGIAAVATCGTALTEDHFQILRRFAPRVVVLFDGDEAGLRAAEAVAQLAGAVDVDLEIATLPDGLDPADAVRSDPQLVRSSLADATPAVRFRLERLLARADLATVEGRSRAAHEGLAVVAAVKDPLVRSQYLALLADRTGFAVQQLASLAPQGAREASPVLVSTPPLDRPAAAALAALLRSPDVADVVVPALFRDPSYRGLAEALVARGDRDVADVLANTPEDVQELSYRIVGTDLDIPLDEALVVLVLREADVELRRWASRLTGLNPTEREEALRAWSAVSRTLHRLRADPRDLEAAGELLDFVVEARTQRAEETTA